MNDDITSGPSPEGASEPGRPRKRAVAVAAAVGVAGLVGGGLAAGALSSASASTDGNGGGRPGYGAPRGYGGQGVPAGPAGPAGEGRPGQPPREHKEVTGATKTKVVAAVKATYPDATVEHVHEHPKGAYEALVTNAGKRLVVLVSKDFKVTGTRTPPAGGPGRHAGPPPGGGPGGERPAPPNGERPAPPKGAPGSAEDPGTRTS